jgi:hypothetical protein
LILLKRITIKRGISMKLKIYFVFLFAFSNVTLFCMVRKNLTNNKKPIFLSPRPLKSNTAKFKAHHTRMLLYLKNEAIRANLFNSDNANLPNT